MKSVKHQGMTAAPPVTSDDHPATPTTTGVNPNDYGAAILFLEMKGRMQETRIAELEEMVQTLATEFQKFTGNTSTGNTTNNTTNVNLIVQMAVDNDNKVGVTSGMGRVPEIPDVVREQLEYIIPLSINSLFVKNQRLNDEGDDTKKGILQYACQDDVPWGEDADNVDPNTDISFEDEDVYDAMQKMLMSGGSGGCHQDP